LFCSVAVCRSVAFPDLVQSRAHSGRLGALRRCCGVRLNESEYNRRYRRLTLSRIDHAVEITGGCVLNIKEGCTMKPSLDEVMAAVEDDDNVGFCMSCGECAYGVEPDAEEYECESCGEFKVYGAELILIMICP
jgi:hypothetical protein